MFLFKRIFLNSYIIFLIFNLNACFSPDADTSEFDCRLRSFQCADGFSCKRIEGESYSCVSIEELAGGSAADLIIGGNQIGGDEPPESGDQMGGFEPPESGSPMGGDEPPTGPYTGSCGDFMANSINLRFPDSPDPNALDFGPSPLSIPRVQSVVVENCGDQPLAISSIRVEGAEFGLGEGLPPSYPARLPPVTDGNVSANSFEVIFTAPDLNIYTGTLFIESNDPIYPILEIPLHGRGSINSCPVAEVSTPELVVPPLEIITLDGSSSVDPDGANGLPVYYEWTVTQRPSSSTAQPVERFNNPSRPADGGLEDDPTTPQAYFFVDIVGEYVIELTVEDDQRFSAPSAECPQSAATIYINARPEGAIHVELTWHTPNDPDETDLEGTDVDLHLLHPDSAGWANGLSNLSRETYYDCYYANTNPEWGPAGPDGNPSLDIDDTNGAGPENITIDSPEITNNGYYRVGVHYYSSGDGAFGEDYGASDATLRIYLQGGLSRELTQRLNSIGNFWDVAGIEWLANSSQVVEINRLYEYTP